MHESMHYKNEFLDCLRNYSIMVFQSGDLNKIKDLMIKYSFIEGAQRAGKYLINQQESITNLLTLLDESVC